MLLVLLPLAGFLVFIDFSGYSIRNGKVYPLRQACLKTAAILGAYLALVSELLSLLHALGSWEVAVAWGLVMLVAGGIGWRKGYFSLTISQITLKFRQTTRFERGIAVALAILLGLLLVIIYYAPVNNSDSLQYHMSRVMHWAQDQSLAHYATGFTPQLSNPIWAEEAILHMRLLWGDDRFAELVQWVAMLGSLIGVSWMAAQLGANRTGQLAAGLFCASIPMGILQATSTQNDYVAGFWLISLACFTVLAVRDPSAWNLVTLGCALGLGLLTKGTFYPYALPMVIWLGVLLLRRYGIGRSTRVVLLLAAIVLVINLGYWMRNLITFQNPLGPAQFVESTTSANASPGFIAGAVVRNVLMNYVTPSDAINTRLHNSLVAVFGRFDPSLKGFVFSWGWNHEDRAGNPLHMVMVLFSVPILFIYRKQVKEKMFWAYLAAALAVFLLLATVIKIDQYGIRYQLPFFIIWAPIFGCLAALVNRTRWIQGLMILLLVLMVPWVVYNRTRSLIAFQNQPGPFTVPCSWGLGCGVRSVLLEPPATILFVNLMPYKDTYLLMAETIKSHQCQKIGLAIDSWDSEYIFWWILGAPQNGTRIETIYTTPELQKLIDPGFHPCAVICKICGTITRFHGLEMKSDYTGAKLYLGEGYTPQP